MAHNSIRVNAPAEAVFDVLVDPASYILWVVGAKHIRGVDADWPQPGSRLHHTVGLGPFQNRDTTEVLEIDRPRRLVLNASAWPLGTARVEVTLSTEGDVTVLRMRETPQEGLAARFNSPVMELGLFARNTLSLWRFGRWAEERHRGTPGHEPGTPSHEAR